MKSSTSRHVAGLAGLAALCAVAVGRGETPVHVSVDWSNVVATSRASVTLEVCLEPPLRRGYPLHDKLFAALRDVGANYAHFQPWNVFPALGIAELEPPSNGKTHWNLKLLDEAAQDFMTAAAGRPVIFNVGALPAWMFKTKKPVSGPKDPDAADWSYAEFNDRTVTDESVRLAADYQARLASWFINGEFVDEAGVRHVSGHHYDIAYWEVLNEPDFEGSLGPADYTKLYDAIVQAIRKVAPKLKFMGPAVGDATRADYFTYFLDGHNHAPGIPIDMVSYHLFAIPDPDEPPDVQANSFFRQADTFVAIANYIESLKGRFQPDAKTDADNVATMLPDPLAPTLTRPIPHDYWNLSGATFAYLYGQLALLGLDAVGISELIDFPGMAAASTLVDWDTGIPTARYWVLRLLKDNFGPGDGLIGPPAYTVLYPNPAPNLYSQGFISAKGLRKILLVNKRGTSVRVVADGARGGTLQVVDQTTVGLAGQRPMASDSIDLGGYAVAVVTLPESPQQGPAE